jgi:hypothetical protein
MLIKTLSEWNRIIHEGTGFIFNDFGTQFPGKSPTWNTKDFNKLHSGSCSYVKTMTYTSNGKLTKHFFESKHEAIEWLKKNRKREQYSFCTHCKP